MCPDLSNKNGFWAKAFSEKYAAADSVIYYYVSRRGDVVFGVNGEDKGVFFSGVDTRRMIWGMVDVYGNSNVIELVDPRGTLNNIRSSQNVMKAPVAEIKLRKPISSEKVSKLSEDSCGSKRMNIHQVQSLPSKTLNIPRPRRNSPSESKSYSSSSSSTNHDQSHVQTECVICYESDVDCVLYSCGHMCMCYQCATQQWSASGECPLCRATIRDVIRTYRA